MKRIILAIAAAFGITACVTEYTPDQRQQLALILLEIADAWELDVDASNVVIDEQTRKKAVSLCRLYLFGVTVNNPDFEEYSRVYNICAAVETPGIDTLDIPEPVAGDEEPA